MAGCGCNNITKTCSCKVSCGCQDRPLVTCPPCVTPPCINGDKCAETFSAACIVYTGDPIVDLGINTGDRVDKILQQMALLLTNPGCAYPTSPCLSVMGLQSGVKTTSTIAITWLPLTMALSYQTQYKLSTATTWLLNPPVTTPSDLARRR